MSAAATPAVMTADEFFEWAGRPENVGRRYELEQGRVVEMPSPSEFHGAVCFLVGLVLGDYIRRRGRGAACSNDAGLLVAEGPDTVRGPDLMFFDESRPVAAMSRRHSQRIPTLVVEVLSPSDRPNRVQRRVQQYLNRGVSVVWVIDPEDRTVAVYERGQFHRLFEEADELEGGELMPDFRAPVASFFNYPGQS
jgi:Uma2 family endonuclease